MNGKGWYFVKLGEFKKNEKNYSVTMKRTIEINRRLEELLGMADAGFVDGRQKEGIQPGTASQG